MARMVTWRTLSAWDLSPRPLRSAHGSLRTSTLWVATPSTRSLLVQAQGHGDPFDQHGYGCAPIRVLYRRFCGYKHEATFHSTSALLDALADAVWMIFQPPTLLLYQNFKNCLSELSMLTRTLKFLFLP